MPKLSSLPFPNALLPFILALALFAPRAHALIQIEGMLEDDSGDKTYDLRILVAAKTGPGAPRTLQTIVVPMVAVADGRFLVSLDTDLEAYSLDGLAFEILARPSESHRPFRSAVVSRISGL